MPSKPAVETRQKVSVLWSSRRGRRIAVRIRYEVRVERGCKIYQLSPTEELFARYP